MASPTPGTNPSLSAHVDTLLRETGTLKRQMADFRRVLGATISSNAVADKMSALAGFRDSLTASRNASGLETYVADEYPGRTGAALLADWDATIAAITPVLVAVHDVLPKATGDTLAIRTITVTGEQTFVQLAPAATAPIIVELDGLLATIE